VSEFYLTRHAVDQFIARVAPSSTYEDAERALCHGLRQSALLKERTHGGQSRYLVANPKCVAIVREAVDSRFGQRTVVTVLGLTDRGEETSAKKAVPPGPAPEAERPYLPSDDPAWDGLRREFRGSLSRFLCKVAASRLPSPTGAVFDAFLRGAHGFDELTSVATAAQSGRAA
jgi:hypothetical protein